MRQRLTLLAVLLAAVCAVSLLGFTLPWVTRSLALIPRETVGLAGIFGMPFVHGSLGHLLSNLPPLAVLAALVLMRSSAHFVFSTGLILLLGGGLLWCFGQAGFHIGASLLVFGYFGFLVAHGYFSRQFGPVLLAVVVVVVYGGMLWGVLPNQPGVSWDGHLAGLIAGVITARIASPSSARGRR